MSIQTEQQYIVHLDIPATALDPSEAVHEALDQVRLGGLGGFVCSVEEVGHDARVLGAPSQRIDFAEVMDHAWADKGHKEDHRFHGEFLG